MKIEKLAKHLTKADRFTLEPRSISVYGLKSKSPDGFVQVESEEKEGYTVELLDNNIIYIL